MEILVHLIKLLKNNFLINLKKIIKLEIKINHQVFLNYIFLKLQSNPSKIKEKINYKNNLIFK